MIRDYTIIIIIVLLCLNVLSLCRSYPNLWWINVYLFCVYQ